jgi:hypothetical protein
VNVDLITVVQQRAFDAAFGRPVIQNNLRAIVVEAIVDLALSNGWRWCSQDWAAWDFEHDDGSRLEVKQAAAKQTWQAPARPSAPRFDIAERTGRWEGSVWIAEPGRNAHIYVFAHHPIVDETADQRDPRQWRFYVIETAKLPSARTISLQAVERLTPPSTFDELRDRAEMVRRALKKPGSPLSRG